MTRERAKELLPVIQAWTEGKEIQVALLGSNQWSTFRPTENNPYADFSNKNWKWRVKPEAREWDLFVSDSGFLTDINPVGKTYERVHVKEVL